MVICFNVLLEADLVVFTSDMQLHVQAGGGAVGGELGGGAFNRPLTASFFLPFVFKNVKKTNTELMNYVISTSLLLFFCLFI